MILHDQYKKINTWGWMRWVQNANKPARRCLGHFWVLENSHDFVCDLTGLYRGRAVFLSVTFTGGLVGCWCWVELFRPKRETPEPSGWNQVSEQTLVQTPTQDHCHQLCTHSKFRLPKVVSKMKVHYVMAQSSLKLTIAKPKGTMTVVSDVHWLHLWAFHFTVL